MTSSLTEARLLSPPSLTPCCISHICWWWNCHLHFFFSQERSLQCIQRHRYPCNHCRKRGKHISLKFERYHVCLCKAKYFRFQISVKNMYFPKVREKNVSSLTKIRVEVSKVKVWVKAQRHSCVLNKQLNGWTEKKSIICPISHQLLIAPGQGNILGDFVIFSFSLG